METTLANRPTRGLRRSSSLFSSPAAKFFNNDLFDLWDGGRFVETVPSLNVKEEKDRYIVDLAAPGLKKEDFNIEMDGNLLTISSDKETDTKENGKEGFSRREYSYSCFSRSITLPDYTDTKGIEAKYTDGVLSLTIPKKPEAQKSTQKIKVQ